MEKKKDNAQQVMNQYAMFWNYNAHVEHQHNYFNGKPVEEGAEDSAQTQEVPATEAPQEAPQDEPVLNFFAPKKTLQMLILEDWFECISVDRKAYSKAWREAFVSDLMDSEHGAYIARLWGQKDKRLTIKGQIVGTLAWAGVLKGSNLAIARTVLGISPNTRNEDEKKEATTFAKYMGKGKLEPYADWVKDYVDKTVPKR